MCSKPAIASSSTLRAGEAPILEATNLDVIYALAGGDVAAVRNFHLAIGETEFVGLVGESGSGKSTAALALIGMVRTPGRITRGEVRFRGDSLLTKSDDQLRAIRGREIGLIVQNSRAALNPLLTVGHQIANVYRAHHDVSSREASERAVESLAAVGIADHRRWADAYPHQLSGGMAQRILIGMATINEPKLLIADEPTTGLDVTVQAQFLDALQSKVQETRSSVLFVTHDLGIVAHYCDRVAVMFQGEVIEEAGVQDLFARPQHPYTQQLIASSSDRKTTFRSRSSRIDGPGGAGEPNG
jgi:ABC-type dipeptide/oligopeptide/nickel transport system ATPase component